MDVRKLEDLFVEKFLEKFKFTERDVKRAFCLYDKDRNGCLDLAELTNCIQTFLNGVDPENVKELVNRYDINKDGKLTYEEFLVLIKTRSATSAEPKIDKTNSRNIDSNVKRNTASNNAGLINNSTNNFSIERSKELPPRTNKLDNRFGGREASFPPPPPSEIESVIDVENIADISARATSYLNNLKSILLTQANSIKSGIAMKDRLSVHDKELVIGFARDIINRAFKPCKFFTDCIFVASFKFNCVNRFARR